VLQRPTAVTAIPERNLLVVGSPGHLTTYDAVNSVKHAQFSIPKNHTPRLLHVLPSKADVVIVCLEWTVYVQPLRPSKSALVMDLSGVKKKPLTDPLLTSMLGSSSAGRFPVLFVASVLKDSIRSAYLLPTAGETGKVAKEMQPGFKLPLDKGKGIVALTSHPFTPILTVLTVNGELQLYQHTQGAPTLTPIVQYTSEMLPLPVCCYLDVVSQVIPMFTSSKSLCLTLFSMALSSIHFRLQVSLQCFWKSPRRHHLK
jgi:hypothetical protein